MGTIWKNSNKAVLLKSQEDEVEADKVSCAQRALRTKLSNEYT